MAAAACGGLSAEEEAKQCEVLDRRDLVSINHMHRPYEVPLNLKQVAVARWLPKLNLVEVIKIRGNFWRKFGFSLGKKNMLNPEEALFLLERGMLVIENESGKRIPFRDVYDEITLKIGLPCYLSYVKLRNLDYIVFRNDSQILYFDGDEDIISSARKYPEKSFLDICAAYKVYLNSPNWSKQLLAEAQPTAYVVVVTGTFIPASRLIVRLIYEANGTPVLFAIVSSTGHVLLEEFADAAEYIEWNNPLRKNFVFNKPLSIHEEHARCMPPGRRKRKTPAVECLSTAESTSLEAPADDY